MTDLEFLRSKIEKLNGLINQIAALNETSSKREELIEITLEKEKELRVFLIDLPKRDSIRKKILNVSKRFNQFRHKHN